MMIMNYIKMILKLSFMSKVWPGELNVKNSNHFKNI